MKKSHKKYKKQSHKSKKNTYIINISKSKIKSVFYKNLHLTNSFDWTKTINTVVSKI